MKRSAIILAGGKGSRVGYIEKALLRYNNKTIIENTLDVLASVCDEIIISLRDAQQEKQFSDYVTDKKVVYDKYIAKGPLGGIATALENISSKYVFIVACDMPCLNADVINLLFEKSTGYAGAVPRWNNGKCEPLHAVYNTSKLLYKIENALDAKKYNVMAAISQLSDIHYVDVELIEKIDPKLQSFININEPDDIKKMHNSFFRF